MTKDLPTRIKRCLEWRGRTSPFALPDKSDDAQDGSEEMSAGDAAEAMPFLCVVGRIALGRK